MLKDLYHKRFEGELNLRNRLWEILVSSFFQQFVKDSDTVLDVGAGYCEFINNIKCRKKYAVDLNEDTLKFADPSVQVYINCLSDIAPKLTSSVDVVFMSNFLEHLHSKEDILKTFSDVYNILRIDGTLIILQPNIRYAYKKYWDFFDHYIPLSDKSIVEALQLSGFDIYRILPKFLPYTTKSRMLWNTLLVKAYFKLPLLWKIMGKQALIVARRPETRGL